MLNNYKIRTEKYLLQKTTKRIKLLKSVRIPLGMRLEARLEKYFLEPKSWLNNVPKPMWY